MCLADSCAKQALAWTDPLAADIFFAATHH
jgi:hypothetical protein